MIVQIGEAGKPRLKALVLEPNMRQLCHVYTPFSVANVVVRVVGDEAWICSFSLRICREGAVPPGSFFKPSEPIRIYACRPFLSSRCRLLSSGQLDSIRLRPFPAKALEGLCRFLVVR